MFFVAGSLEYLAPNSRNLCKNLWTSYWIQRNARRTARRHGGFDPQHRPVDLPIATGTSPFSVNSTTTVVNLNTGLLDGQTGAFYQNASNINGGTLADARFSSNVALLSGTQTFTGAKTFSSGFSTNAFARTTGAASGWVLTSDVSGNGTWQNPTGALTLRSQAQQVTAQVVFSTLRTQTLHQVGRSAVLCCTANRRSACLATCQSANRWVKRLTDNFQFTVG